MLLYKPQKYQCIEIDKLYLQVYTTWTETRQKCRVLHRVPNPLSSQPNTTKWRNLLCIGSNTNKGTDKEISFLMKGPAIWNSCSYSAPTLHQFKAHLKQYLMTLEWLSLYNELEYKLSSSTIHCTSYLRM